MHALKYGCTLQYALMSCDLCKPRLNAERQRPRGASSKDEALKAASAWPQAWPQAQRSTSTRDHARDGRRPDRRTNFIIMIPI